MGPSAQVGGAGLEPPGLAADAVVGDYRVERLLSRGPVGILHLARGPKAEPVLLRLLTLGGEGRARVERELSRLGSVQSRHVARLLVRGEHEGAGYYVLEDPGSVSLLELVRTCRPLDEAELVWLGRGLAEGLAALHAQGLPHGHLLPTTVAVTPHGPVIVDLGWACRLRRGPPPSPGDDLGALGHVLAFAATGVRPAPGQVDASLRERAPWLSASSSAWLDRLLGPPAGRPSAEEVARACAARAEELGVPEPPAPPASLEPLLDKLPDRRRTETQAPPERDQGEPARSGPDSTLLRLAPGEPVTLRPDLSLVCERVLGEGGMGVVFLVRDPRLGRRAALKLVRQGNPTRVRRFLRETAVTARLNHPGIPPVFEASATPEGQDYLLMRYVEGHSLKEVLDRVEARRRKVEERRTLLDAMVKVGEAVAYAHSRGVVHRDLKPANLMVGAFGEVFVMDWGLARDLNESLQEDQQVRHEFATVLEETRNLTHDGAFLGTPGYMAPEQARGEDVDGRADVFAVGAILCEILTGDPPFTAHDTLELIHQMSDGVVERPRERDRRIAPELDAIVARALAVDRAYRYPSMETLVADLKAYLEGRAVSVYRYGPGEQLLRVMRAHQALTVLLTLFLALLLSSVLLVTRAETEREAAVRESSRFQAQSEAQRLNELNDLVMRGQRALSDGEAELAKEFFVQALALDPSHPEAKLGRARAEHRLEQEQREALGLRDREEALRLIADGKAAQAAGELEQARRSFTQALGFDGKSEAARQGLLEVDRLEQEQLKQSQDQARFKRANELRSSARKSWERGRELARRAEDPLQVQDAYQAALEDLAKAMRLVPRHPVLEQERIRVAQELSLLLRSEGQNDVADYVLRLCQAPAPTEGEVQVPRDPTLEVVEADRVMIRRAFGGVVHFLPTHAFDALRQEIASYGERFRVQVEVRSEVTATIPPKVLVRGFWVRLEDSLARTISPPFKVEFQGGPYARVVSLEARRGRRVVSAFDSAHGLDVRSNVAQVEQHVRRLIEQAVVDRAE